jgi:hypothetical protein
MTRRLALAIVTLVAGCSHVMQVTSEPPGARVTVDGVPAGVTPVSVPESEGLPGTRAITVGKPGYKDFSAIVSKSIDPLTAGGCVTAGIVGCAGINLLTASPLGWLVFPVVGGALFSFRSPDNMHVVLEPVAPSTAPAPPLPTTGQPADPARP